MGAKEGNTLASSLSRKIVKRHGHQIIAKGVRGERIQSGVRSQGNGAQAGCLRIREGTPDCQQRCRDVKLLKTRIVFKKGLKLERKVARPMKEDSWEKRKRETAADG